MLADIFWTGSVDEGFFILLTVKDILFVFIKRESYCPLKVHPEQVASYVSSSLGNSIFSWLIPDSSGDSWIILN